MRLPLIAHYALLLGAAQVKGCGFVSFHAFHAFHFISCVSFHGIRFRHPPGGNAMKRNAKRIPKQGKPTYQGGGPLF